MPDYRGCSKLFFVFRKHHVCDALVFSFFASITFVTLLFFRFLQASQMWRSCFFVFWEHHVCDALVFSFFARITNVTLLFFRFSQASQMWGSYFSVYLNPIFLQANILLFILSTQFYRIPTFFILRFILQRFDFRVLILHASFHILST